jgi:hypothetical protein
VAGVARRLDPAAAPGLSRGGHGRPHP